jgi:hypothetical protein
MAKKKSARRRSRTVLSRKVPPTKFSMRAGHTALKDVLKRLKKIRTPRSKRLQSQIQAIMDATPCPQSMVIEL